MPNHPALEHGQEREREGARDRERVCLYVCVCVCVCNRENESEHGRGIASERNMAAVVPHCTDCSEEVEPLE